ncbi:MAG: DNA polymerase/3'-5' exonuclease PolX [Betaproteobacteria bacterium]|nr:DNA polymerase/3'-5' exonuclease PolX [Betaproteobacteria bacterium]
MPVHNADIAAAFEEIADLLEIQGASPFRVRAYRNASRTVGEFGRDIRSLLESGESFPKLPGIGADLAAKIHEFATTGKSELLASLRAQLPATVTTLLKVPGLGPKRVKMLHEALHVDTLAQLSAAARDGRIRQLPGFGEKTERSILDAAQTAMSRAQRFKLPLAAQYVEALVAYLKAIPDVGQVAVAGSFRRMRETVGDLDVVVTATDPGRVMAALGDYDEVAEILSSGPTRASVVLRNALQIDVRVVAQDSYGAALHYFTGSKAHNIALRRLAQARGLKVNEYGVFRGADRIAGATEASVYACLDLPFIPPELRENRGEIEAARAGRLPHLIERTDLRGDLHAHTVASDGRNSLAEMAQAAKAAGLEYLAITEHSQRLTVAKGLDAAALGAHIERMDRLNEQLKGLTLLKGIEVDILEDGSLDLPDDVLGQLDLVVGAVHGQFSLSSEKQTARILRAMNHPHFSILAHPSGRLLGEREAYEVDMPQIIREAKRRGCFLELDARPERLDLNDIYCQMAKAEGVLVSINSDAHSTLDFANLRYGIGQARRGWLEKADVLNTRSLKGIRPLLAATMG